MMRISTHGLSLIREFEGFCAEPYICAGGKLTIGYGHVLTNQESATLERITREHAEQLLASDAEIAASVVRKAVKVPLTQNQFDALVSFVFNIGEGAFTKSTLLRLLNDNESEAAANQFGRWVYASGRKLEGLIRRRNAEQKLFLATD